MEISFGTIIVIFFVFCYFAFGLKGAAQYVDNNMSNLFQDPKKRWLRYVLIAVAAFIFAFVEFARRILMGIIKLLQIITRG